jgi:predicted nucleotidyltransferase
MGYTESGPGTALFSKTQRRILGLLFGFPERSHYTSEIVRHAGVGNGAALRELERLAESGLVVVARIGNQKHFQANRNASVFGELTSIARKLLVEGPSGSPAAAHETRAVYGVTPAAEIDVSRAALSRLCRKYGIRKLGLFGSAARRELRSTSDVDLLVEFGPESNASLFDFPEMQREFSAVFGNRSVDLVPPQVMRNPHRRKAIMADLRVLYEAR